MQLTADWYGVIWPRLYGTIAIDKEVPTMCMGLRYNKAFKRDSCRVAFLVYGELCGESGLREVGLCGIHPLTQRYVFLATFSADYKFWSVI